MGHGNNQDLVTSDLVDDTVGKPSGSAPASSFGKLSPGFWIPQYPADRVCDLLGKLVPEAFLPVVEVPYFSSNSI